MEAKTAPASATFCRSLAGVVESALSDAGGATGYQEAASAPSFLFPATWMNLNLYASVFFQVNKASVGVFSHGAIT